MNWVTGNCIHCGKETKTALENHHTFDNTFVCKTHLQEFYE